MFANIKLVFLLSKRKVFFACKQEKQRENREDKYINLYPIYDYILVTFKGN